MPVASQPSRPFTFRPAVPVPSILAEEMEALRHQVELRTKLHRAVLVAVTGAVASGAAAWMLLA